MNETLSLATSDGEMGVHVVRPDDDGPYPVVVFFHHGPGLDEGSKEAMQLLADAGYYVISHDRYHRVGPWYRLTPEMRKDQDAMRYFFTEVLMGTTEEMVQADLTAVIEHVDGDPAARDGAMGCIGYCIGARSVVVTMARNARFVAGVGLHPSFCTTDQPDSPHLLAPSITGALYVAFGSADKMQSPEDNVPFIEAVQAMPDGRGEADIHEGADHGFSVPRSPAYHEVAAEISYEKALALFGRTLG